MGEGHGGEVMGCKGGGVLLVGSLYLSALIIYFYDLGLGHFMYRHHG